MSLLNEVEGKTIIGFGEGTHGTAEFNQVRAAISQKLIEERGFQYICFENNYGETFVFNKRFKDLQYTTELLKQHFIGIYQTKEIDDFFKWLTAYNQAHPDKNVAVSGLDFFELTAAVNILKEQVINNQSYSALFAKLSRSTDLKKLLFPVACFKLEYFIYRGIKNLRYFQGK